MNERRQSDRATAGWAAVGLMIIAAVGLMIVGIGVSLSPPPAEAQTAGCGNGKCGGSEDCSTCPEDCGVCPPVCGNAACEAGESCSTCEMDCGVCSSCGDGTCDPDEDCSTCSSDCGTCATCNSDGICDASEDCDSCSTDCGACPTCGDAICSNPIETCSTCSADCGSCGSCGDGTCGLEESCRNCPGDCGTCPSNTDFATCPPDLPPCGGEITGCCFRPFSAGSIVIPLDRCHQALTSTTIRGIPIAGNSFCADPSPTGDGMFEAYGLVYRLMQNDIPVYWAVNPTKDPLALKESEKLSTQTYHDRDIDIWVTQGGTSPPEMGQTLATCGVGCTPPVLRLDPPTLAALPASYGYRQFPLRGGAFIIDAADRARFDDFWLKNGVFAALGGNDFYDFSAVNLYEIQSGTSIRYLDYRTIGPKYPSFHGGGYAPIAVKLDYDPPRLAREYPANVSSLWLNKARLDEPAQYPLCLTGEFVPETAVYCDITHEDVNAGYLLQGNFDWAWLDNWNDASACSDPREQMFMGQLHDFMTGVPGIKDGNSVMFMVSAMESAERCAGMQPLGEPTTTGPGLEPLTTTPTEDFIVRYPGNLFAQTADMPLSYASGSPSMWRYAGGAANGYQSLASLVRLVSEDVSASGNAICSYHSSSSTCDVYDPAGGGETNDVIAYGTFRDVPANGAAYYLAGRNVMQSTNSSHLRSVLNAFISVPAGIGLVPPINASTVEVARSSPVVSVVGGIEAMYQGSIDVIDPPRNVTKYRGTESDFSFEFPHFEGHMRALDVALLDPSVNYDNLTDADVLFDAANGIPPVSTSGCTTHFTDTCRTVFTNTTPGENSDPPTQTELDAGDYGSRPKRVFFDTSNASELAPLLGTEFTATEVNTLISRVLAGRDANYDGVYEPSLGGIDRSTVAVIEESPVTGRARPTMVYVGALDGMLHAICAEVSDYCSYLGQELWAYLPRTQLGALKLNQQRIDGAPTVSDVFGDFDKDGTGEYRTVLTFMTAAGEPGFLGRSPAVVALDITEPNDPHILWELTTSECDCDPAKQDCSATGGICDYTRPDGEHVRDVFDLGFGIHLAKGAVMIGTEQRHLVFAQSNNGGTSNQSGFVVKSIDAVTGLVEWTFGRAYDAARDSNNPPVPVTGFPGGVSAIDADENGTITHLIAPSLYGELWKIDADTGLSSYDGDPLFQFPTTFEGVPGDFHPIGASPTIFRQRGSNKLLALGVSGGYADFVRAAWSPDGVQQFAVAVEVDSPTGLASPVFTLDLGMTRGFAQAIVSGNEIYIVTDEGDINSPSFGLGTANTGKLMRFNLGDDVTAPTLESTTTLSGGASAVDVNEGYVYSGSGRSAAKANFTADYDGDGAGVEMTNQPVASRLLWIRTR